MKKLKTFIFKKLRSNCLFYNMRKIREENCVTLPPYEACLGQKKKPFFVVRRNSELKYCRICKECPYREMNAVD